MFNDQCRMSNVDCKRQNAAASGIQHSAFRILPIRVHLRSSAVPSVRVCRRVPWSTPAWPRFETFPTWPRRAWPCHPTPGAGQKEMLDARVRIGLRSRSRRNACAKRGLFFAQFAGSPRVRENREFFTQRPFSLRETSPAKKIPERIFSKISPDRGEGGSTKSEARNPKSETNPNDRNTDKATSNHSLSGFGHCPFWTFEFVSSFVLRISNF